LYTAPACKSRFWLSINGFCYLLFLLPVIELNQPVKNGILHGAKLGLVARSAEVLAAPGRFAHCFN
jgi:hypothetical protein